MPFAGFGSYPVLLRRCLRQLVGTGVVSSSDGVRTGFLEVPEAHGDAAASAGGNGRACLIIQNANVTVHSSSSW